MGSPGILSRLQMKSFDSRYVHFESRIHWIPMSNPLGSVLESFISNFEAGHSAAEAL
jgi:hypothetical protein